MKVTRQVEFMRVTLQYNFTVKGGSQLMSTFSALLKPFFLLTKSFGCQGISFRYWIKENFEPCLKSVGHIITELCHFPWNPFILKLAKNIHIELKEKIFDSPKIFFLPTKSFGCQGKSFRYRPKENFDTCLRSVGLIFSEIWPFLWEPTFWTSNFDTFLTILKLG